MLSETALGRKSLSPGEIKFHCCSVAKYFSLEIKEAFATEKALRGSLAASPSSHQNHRRLFWDLTLGTCGFLGGKP